MKIENAKNTTTIKMSLKGETQNSTFYPIMLQLAIYPSFQLQIVICLEYWILDFLSFHTILIFPKKLIENSLNFGSNLISLCYHALCTTFLQSTISPLFQLRIVIRLKCWIPNFLNFKTICGLP